ncbi:GrpB family protein [Natronorubrum sp. JWXQ-INN-674]|uniref:GrpB family protein n=1 Tax=Natronorubrum halalkaliphilum TaxID=2691917 RepID=A0A6B0VRS6_9EURY|nr:GrpB family protein [Natronorubrum halalkaliphilum]MXV64144.1 GrpB family protein [Natronorubrum halalkaliphilum]
MVSTNDDPIELVPARTETWREQFTEERDRIDETLADASLESTVERIEHVGSTAVPDLAAKDIVDLDIVVADGAVREVSRTLETELGGDRIENSDEWHPVFRRENGQRFNDHVFAASSDGWKISVVTREILAAEPTLRAEYEALKRELAAEHDELVAYSRGKTAFIKRALDVARASDGLSFDFEVPINNRDDLSDE